MGRNLDYHLTMPLYVLDHPLAQHLVAGLRDVETPPERFRDVARNLSRLIVYESTRQMPTTQVQVQTPLEETSVNKLGTGLAVVPILRAGLSMLEAALELFPDVAVGYIGLERSHDTAIAHSYYVKLPKLTGRYTLCMDPMLATGGSASQALSLLKANGAKDIVMVSVIAAPEGVAKIQEDHPDVSIYVAALDRELNDLRYIIPGLGDYGDRLYGTQ